jgi:hypothetical protein
MRFKISDCRSFQVANRQCLEPDLVRRIFDTALDGWLAGAERLPHSHVQPTVRMFLGGSTFIIPMRS